MEPPMPVDRVHQPRSAQWYAVCTNGVPHADETYSALVRVQTTEKPRRDTIRLGGAAPVSIEGEGVIDQIAVLAPEDSRIADQTGGASCRVGAPTESEEVELVAGFEIPHHETVDISHIAGKAVAEGSAEKPLRPLGADPRLVEHQLVITAVIFIGNGERDFRHVGRRG